MGLYINGEKIKININGNKYDFNLFASIPITNGIRIISSEGFTLRDITKLYLTTKEGDNN